MEKNKLNLKKFVSLKINKLDSLKKGGETGYRTENCEGTTKTTIFGQVYSDTNRTGDWISTC